MLPRREAAKPPIHTGLPDRLKAGIEALTGHDMSDVRVHFNSTRPAQLRALAFTQGTAIHVAPGQSRHLEHEAWHVVQQKQGRVRPEARWQGVWINGDPDLEREADVMGARASRAFPPIWTPARSAREGEPAARPAAGAQDRPSPPGPGEGPLGVRAAGPATPVVQRKVGFEIETGIPITKRTFDDEDYVYTDPTADNGDFKIDTDRQGKIHVDHVPGHITNKQEQFDEDWPIIEFVSEPQDETRPADEFEATATSWLDLLKQLRDKIEPTPLKLQGRYKSPKVTPARTVPLKPVVQSSPGDIHIGFITDGNNVIDPAAGGVNRVSVQMTIGARLDRLQELNKTIQVAKIGGSMAGPAFAFDVEAPTVAAKLMEFLEGEIGAPKKPGRMAGDKKKAEVLARPVELQGFLQLLCNYLIAGRKYTKGLTKDRTFVFYKSQLSDVATQLIASNEYAARVLNNDQVAERLKQKILELTKRGPDEHVFFPEEVNKNTMPKCEEWLDEVFSRKQDRVLLDAKNPWSKVINPEAVEGRMAPVLELRSPSWLDPVASQAKAAFNLRTDPNAVVAHLKALYLLQQQWQGIKVKG
jgi:hypothetical protein